MPKLKDTEVLQDAVLHTAIIIVFWYRFVWSTREVFFISAGRVQLVGALVHRRPGLDFKMASSWRESLLNTGMFFIRDKSKKSHLTLHHYIHK